LITWNVIVFESERGEKLVEEFIKSLSPSTKAKVIHGIDLLEKHGPYVGMPHTRKVSNLLYELRVRGKEEVRIFYAFSKEKIILLHGFKKKKQKTPLKEITTSSKRLNSIIERI